MERESPIHIKKKTKLEFPSSPVVRTLCFHFREHGFNPWSGN